MKTITVAAGRNLFQIASVQLQDATQWVRIAMQNGITDPFLPSGAVAATVVLTIPDLNPNAGGGLPPL